MDRRLLLSPVCYATAVLLTASALAQDVAPSAPLVDATLESVRGGERSLRAERGRRVVVLFYEDRPHVEDNEAVKGNLRRFIASNHLEERLVVYGVANLGDLGNAAPRALVRQMIAPLEERWGVEILLDWDGELRRAPFSFATNAANVGVVDREGRLVFRHTGTLDRRGTRELYRVLRRALRAE